MKDEVWQKRQFILSSFYRQKIKISTEVYRFIDKLILDNWDFTRYQLTELDKVINEEFFKFLNK
jgi:hypothetical protein